MDNTSLWAKIPFWVKFAVVFVVIVVALFWLLIMSGPRHSEFDGMGFAIVFILPPMFLLAGLGLEDVEWLLMLSIFIYLFGLGSLIGFLVHKFRIPAAPEKESDIKIT